MKTSRGFEVKHFLDSYGVDCSIQESSNAESAFIWLGVHDAEAKIMAVDLDKVKGFETTPTPGSSQTTGWHKILLPKEVHIFSRMHLDKEQAKRLIRELQYFVKHGCLSEEE